MSQVFAITRFLREVRRLLSRRSSRFTLLFWPVTCCAFCVLVWGIVETKIAAEQRASPRRLVHEISRAKAASGLAKQGLSEPGRISSLPSGATAAMHASQALAADRQDWKDNRLFALGVSTAMLLFAIVATWLAARGEWRRRYDHDVSTTYRIATEGSNEGFYMMRPILDRQGLIVDWEVKDCNEVGASFLGPRRAALLGSRLSTFYQGHIFDAVMRVYQTAIDKGVFEDDYEVPTDSPLALRWMQRRLVHLDAGVAVTLRDISALKAHEHDLIRLGNEDALTTLPNRHWMMQFLPMALSRAVANQTRTALLFIDLDGFKIINDSCGHAEGDQLLQAVALRIKALLRPSDQVVRIGGDEFLIIIENVVEDAAVAPVAQRVIDTVSSPFELAHGPHVVGASIGISIFPRDGADSGELLRHADIAMYAAKASGKGRYRFYEAELHEDLAQRASTEELLRSAIAQGAFTTMYQPRVETGTGNIVGLQALVRWRREDGDLALPAEFLGLAEETGLILRLGELVLDQVCLQLAEWRSRQLPLVPVSINLSARQFSSRFVAIVQEALERYQIDANLLAFEVSEASIIGNDDRIAPELHSLHALGVEVMIDDFGVSYRSLSTLRRCGIRTLKVDRTLTAQLGNLRHGDVFYQAILSTAHAMGLVVVAEGVETDAQFSWLRAHGCDQVTGYLIAPPLQAPAVPALLLSGWHMLAEPLSA